MALAPLVAGHRSHLSSVRIDASAPTGWFRPVSRTRQAPHDPCQARAGAQQTVPVLTQEQDSRSSHSLRLAPCQKQDSGACFPSRAPASRVAHLALPQDDDERSTAGRARYRNARRAALGYFAVPRPFRIHMSSQRPAPDFRGCRSGRTVDRAPTEACGQARRLALGRAHSGRADAMPTLPGKAGEADSSSTRPRRDKNRGAGTRTTPPTHARKNDEPKPPGWLRVSLGVPTASPDRA
jgi:hypothetical protein